MDTIEKLVDLLETQEPECVVTVNTGYTYEDDEGARRRIRLRCYPVLGQS